VPNLIFAASLSPRWRFAQNNRVNGERKDSLVSSHPALADPTKVTPCCKAKRHNIDSNYDYS
jgi:hypothetical protein